ncbi:MAG: hypothetical protein ACE5HO_21805, partial [bacterium]
MKTHSGSTKISGQKLARHLVSFARVLRRVGLSVGTEQIVDALRALDYIGIRNPADVYQALYCICVTRKEQADLFDQVFHLFWQAPAKLPQMMSLILPKLDLPATVRSKQSLRIRQALMDQEQENQLNKSRRENE